jgi:hypothetical protein
MYNLEFPNPLKPSGRRGNQKFLADLPLMGDQDGFIFGKDCRVEITV